MKNTYIIDGIRTPVGNYKGTLSAVRPDDLAAHVIRTIIEKHPEIPQEDYADVIMGCANQAGEDNRNVARMAGLLAGLPFSVPGETVNRLCSSGLSSIVHAHRAIQTGDGDVFISVTGVPTRLYKRVGFPSFPEDGLWRWSHRWDLF